MLYCFYKLDILHGFCSIIFGNKEPWHNSKRVRLVQHSKLFCNVSLWILSNYSDHNNSMFVTHYRWLGCLSWIARPVSGSLHACSHPDKKKRMVGKTVNGSRVNYFYQRYSNSLSRNHCHSGNILLPCHPTLICPHRNAWSCCLFQIPQKNASFSFHRPDQSTIHHFQVKSWTCELHNDLSNPFPAAMLEIFCR